MANLASAAPQLQRTAFTTSRALEFFSEKDLARQIGFDSEHWGLALLKELIDNGLDACENSGLTPVIEVTIANDHVCVADNGPGLPGAILNRSLDYQVRVSDKAHYVSPTRGQLGNALKCLWAAPFVLNDGHGQVIVETQGVRHQIDVVLDRIAQQPKITSTRTPSVVKTGTFIRFGWPDVA